MTATIENNAGENHASAKYRLKVFGLYAIFYVFFYNVPNLYPLFTPVQLPLNSIDLAVPFLPWTFLIYLSPYLLILIAIIMLNDKPSFLRLARMGFVNLFICGLFFLFYPTCYLRPEIPEISNPLIRFCVWLVHTVDKPNNCFPSMHICGTLVAVLAIYLGRGAKTALPFFIWMLAIHASTLTTKQHYFIDILGGYGVAAVSYVLTHLACYRRREPTFPF